MKGTKKKPENEAVAAAATTSPEQEATEGQRLLRAVAASNAEVAARVGVSKAIVGFWRTGRKLPAPEMRRVLATLYDIPAGSWDSKPAGAEKAPPSFGSMPVAEALRAVGKTNREGVESMLEAILRQRQAGGLTVQEFTRLVDAEAKVRKLIHDLDQAEQLTETRIVQSPTFTKVRNLIFGVLRNHPDVLRDVVSALRGAGAQ